MNNKKTVKPLGLFGLLSKNAPNKVFFGLLLGCIAGFGFAVIMPLILTSLKPALSVLMTSEFVWPYLLFGKFEIFTPKFALAFFLVCIFILICRATSEAILARVAIDASIDLRKDMYKRVSQLPIQDLDRIGPSRLITSLDNDVPKIVEGASIFPDLIVATTTLIGLLSFLVYLNVNVLLFILGVIIFGAITYRIPLYFAQEDLTQSRETLDGLQEGTRGLIYGAKELKLNIERRKSYYNMDLDAHEEEFRETQKRGMTTLIFGMTYGNMVSFFSIGAVTFVMGTYYSLTPTALVGVVMVMFYIMGPISTLIRSVGPVMQASIAAKKLSQLINEMPVEPASQSTEPVACDEINLENVSFSYPQQEDEDTSFNVGPFDLSIKRGEITFLVGGNGSGKTTLGKILSLHYLPNEGNLLFNNVKITDENREMARQNVSAIYADFYLFTRLFGMNEQELDAKAGDKIKELGLEGKVKIKNGQFSSTSLSAGQKKRLALLVAYLEERDIYVFDEWAADQDPEFKEVFYHQILPSLKEKNKLLIVISHDDRYFHLADKIIRMENGKVISQETHS
ncbi:cyclic peptide export ABC transporter [Marinicellulosiphila megalodicopiae]|uniref:cyclic peptide export ABC transporter n=1 Tax=Marinicellulosiphila megalodicopiae TaxID=2724896 RepID=UPI003BB0D51F